MIHSLKQYFQDKNGATAIEYGLIAALISLAIATSVFAFGDTLNRLFFEQLPALFGTLVQ